MTNFRTIFENDFCGIGSFISEVLSPVFGEHEKIDYNLTDEKEVAEKAIAVGITKITYATKFDFYGSELKIYDITVGDDKKLEKNKVGIQSIVRQYIEQFEGALLVFHHQNVQGREWRLSYVEKRTNAKDTTSAKRYTYILGKGQPARTITDRFSELLAKKEKEPLVLQDLTVAFSVSTVSDEFFEEYKVFYEDFVQYITGNRYVKSGGKYERKAVGKENSEIFEQFKKYAGGDYELSCKYVRDYVKKFMGRLVFLQFLQKKGWLGGNQNEKWGNGDRNFLLNLFEKSNHQDDFLDTVLEPLFFGMLNTSEDGREDLFKQKKWDSSLLKEFGRIPYLNGGLFEADDLDKIKIKFPKEMFSNPHKSEVERKFNDKADYTNKPYPFTESCGLLDFFTCYNFTIDETDPSDMEIGVDPEMLGKIFENLLEDNKDKGAFYTPKEIVQYMCRESLIAYLIDAVAEEKGAVVEKKVAVVEPVETTTDDSKLRIFVEHHDASAFTQDEKSALLRALKDVKICDPAVGSGAFPMGMLNELYACRVALGETDYSEQNTDYSEQITGNSEQITDNSEQNCKLITDNCELITDNCKLNIKKQIVKNNIYGVDIEKGAVDIARLRFWLAIIVDEDEPIPLPNLDYKIMQGNSLLESFEGIDLSKITEKDKNELFDDADDVKTLVTSLGTYFDTNDHADKEAHREAIKSAVLDLLEKRGYSTEGNLRNDLSKLDLHENSEFFLWHTWFYDVFNRPRKEGFDIVIGNPPYISAPTQIANKKLAEQRERLVSSKKYKTLYQKWDLYIPFIELGTQLNCEGGITAMIVPFPLTNQLYAKMMRKTLTEDFDLFELVDLNGTKIFDNATVSNCIPFVRKPVIERSKQKNVIARSEATKQSHQTWISHINEKLEITRDFQQPNEKLVQDEKTYVWNLTQEERKTNRHEGMHVLGDYCYISIGMVLNADEKVAKGEFTKDELISNTKDKIHCKKYIEGKDLERYEVKRIRYLEYGTKRSPGQLRRPTFEELYTNDKLLINALGNLKVSIDSGEHYYCEQQVRMALPWYSLHGVENKSITSSIKKFSTMTRPQMEELSKTVSLKYLLGVMNSKYASVLLTNNRGGDYHITPEHIRNIPIPAASPAQQQEIISLVDQILAVNSKQSTDDSKQKSDNSKQNCKLISDNCELFTDDCELEKQIDKKVYAFYGLSEDEIKIVEKQ